MTMKKMFFYFALIALVGVAIAQVIERDATADGAPYSVSLNSPATFPVDI